MILTALEVTDVARKMPIITIVGILVGAAIGAALGNVFVGLVYGLIAGAVIGAYSDRRITTRGWLGK